MIKEAAFVQQQTASNKKREQIQKTRFRMPKEYQEYLRQKNSHRKTPPKHKVVILNYKPVQSETHHDSSDESETTDSEEDLDHLADTPDVDQRSSDIELEASDEEVDEASDEEMDEAG